MQEQPRIPSVDKVLMFELLILQQLYNISEDEHEH
ncbi:hypothetical protein KR51_00001320 [Rubidibacter lacunae KORDI 51-2]|uniref:Uncharacterized protein n=1 Tax=Rubidibacter lacunae KORDI 51-2 TaxID=582515 RepID=U5DQF8_9CHRO|nr:hypothetical protein KR51_00001320 [Rubidibacter lacunae KORDI 51-2]